MDGKFLLEMGEGKECVCVCVGGGGRLGDGGGVIIIGGWNKSLDIVDRGVLTPLFHENPLILPIPPFSNVVQHPPPHHHTPNFPVATFITLND